MINGTKKLKSYDMKLVKGKQNDEFEKLVERYNERVELFGSKDFNNMVKMSKKTGDKKSSMTTVKTLIAKAQEEHKKFTTNLDKMSGNIGSKNDKLKTSNGELSSVVIPSIESTEQKAVKGSIKTLDQVTEKLGVVLDDSDAIIKKMKEKKFGFKKEALEYLGVISDKTLNNAQKYMEEDMLRIKEKLDEYLAGKTENLKIVKDMFKSKDRKAWEHNYDKINKAANKEGVSVEAEFEKAVVEAKTAGENISISPMPEAENINKNYDETRKSEMEKVAEKVKAESDRICVKYKITKGKTLIELIINYTFQNKFMKNLNKSLASQNRIFLSKFSAGFVKINNLIKKISANKIKSDGDIKKRNFSLVSILLKIIKTLLKIVLEATYVFLSCMLLFVVVPVCVLSVDPAPLEGLIESIVEVHKGLWSKN